MNNITRKLLLLTVSTLLTESPNRCMELDSELVEHESNRYTLSPDVQRSAILEGQAGNASLVALSPDGVTVLAKSLDKTACLWDVTTGKLLQVLRGHTDSIWSVTFSPDGKTVLTASRDKTARLWCVETGKQLQVFKGHTEALSLVIVSPDGRIVFDGIK